MPRTDPIDSVPEAQKHSPEYDDSELSDSEDDDPATKLATSDEIDKHDQDVLNEEEETEKLLTGKTLAEDGKSRTFAERVQQRRNERRQRRAQRKGRGHSDEQKELIYDTEEGRQISRSSSESSSELDREKLGRTLAIKKKKSRKARCFRCCIWLLIPVLFIAIAFAAYSASRDTRVPLAKGPWLSNGTNLFAPTTILLSLDGFRADFLQRNITPTLNQFIRNGVSPKYMLPSFPSVTFPNHYTLVTGLYPESHGIVGNSFYAPEFDEEFYYTHPEHSMQPKWWSNEPLWVTAEEQNVKTAIHMWPGSEAHIGHLEPAYVDKFNDSEVLPAKVNRVLELLDLPGPQDAGAMFDKPRPQLIAAYVPNVDADGHKYGPNSTEIQTTISDADAMVEAILTGLEERNLTNIVNIVVVSDHGMATTSTDRTVQLEDLIDMDKIAYTDGWPHYGLRPKDPADIQPLYEQLAEHAKDHPGFDVYLRDVDMPERYHFTQNERIAPLWVMPRTGWAIVTKDDFNVAEAKANGDVYHPRGIHGYDHEHPLMRAIFIARGPAFPHPAGSRLDVFQNTNVYNIICDSIGVDPMPNNGTLRLPLRPNGLHSDPEEDDGGDDMYDYPPEDATHPAAPSVTRPSFPRPTDADSSLDTEDGHGESIPDEPSSPSDGEQGDGDGEKEDDDKAIHIIIWDWLQDTAQDFSDWVKGTLHDLQNLETEDGTEDGTEDQKTR